MSRLRSGLFYCFSCAEGGDVIKFVQKIDGLSFVEAVERLAGRAGIDLRYEQGGYVPGQEQSQRRRLIDAHRAAAAFYAERLGAPDAAPARAFLAERGFELADIERFGVGYSPKAWEDLTRHLRGRGFTDADLIAAGLAREGNRGARDRFRGRLMWPIRDLSGDVIAFGARKLDPDDDGPKYLNTPETSLFHKSTVLYGADLAKREIAQHRQAVIVEGYTDVMACHLAGVPTAVATCGTSFGEDHIKVLRRLIMDTDRVPRRGDLHLRRRRGRPAGGPARVRDGREVRHADVRDRAARRAGPVRRPAGARRRGRPRPDRPARAAVRVRHQGRPRPARRQHHRGPARGAGRGRAHRGQDQGPRAAQAVRHQPGPLAGPDGRAVRAGPGERARGRRGHARPGRRGAPPELVRLRTADRGTAGRGPTAGRLAGRRPALQPERPRDLGGARGAEARGPAARRCAGRNSTRSARTPSPRRCTARCSR